MIKFPREFLWGAATSAYQVEGGNKKADWWVWEKKAGKERSGRATRHYEFFEKDFDLAERLCHNAHRFSVEWSRIEPKEGKFSQKELRHYAEVVRALRKRHIEPVVTLHHFTNPVWFSEAGGWTDRRSVARYVKFCEAVVEALAPEVRYWITINEPTIYISHAYILGVWPPQSKSYLKAAAVEEHLVSAHVEGYRAIHDIYQVHGYPPPLVGIAQNMTAFVPCKHNLKDRFAAYLRDKVYNLAFLDRLRLHDAMDFIGVNYYSRQLVELRKWGVSNLATDVCERHHHQVPKNALGWDVYPKGIYDVLLEVKKYQRPVMITENGVCTSDDNLRWKYLRTHLRNVYRALQKGVHIKGYLYWSLLDNFEWDKGFGPRFGLIDVNYRTYKRTVRPSAKKFAQICKTGILR